jgi:glucokinase
MYIGIEIGGTKLQVGVGAGDGVLRGLWRETVDVPDGPEGIRRHIVRAIPELLTQSGMQQSQLRGVGIGFGGPVDDATHTIIKSHQIEGWDGFPLADWIADLAGLPTALGNDADVAGLAEALFGAGKGLSPIFYITIGSGIGGGFVIHGEIYRGCRRGAAEIGHVLIHRLSRKLGPECVPLEQLASGWAIAESAKELFELEVGRRSTMFQMWRRDPASVTAQVVAEAARLEDTAAVITLHRAWTALAEAICQVIALLCPRRIIIGGGVSLIGEKLLFEPLRRLVAERVFPPFAECYEIVPSALGEEVVVHGALALARRSIGGTDA